MTLKSRLNKKGLFLIYTICSLFLALIASQGQAATDPYTNTTTSTAVPLATAPMLPPQPAQSPTLTPSSPDINANGYVLMDAKSGQILAEKNLDTHLQPASLTKMMTLYVVSSALQSGQIHLNDLVTISKTAWKTGGSRMFVQVGTQVPVQDLIQGVIVASGNDAAVALAEYVGGTQENFVNLMNQDAAKLGMVNSHFVDVNGLPVPDHFSSPRDLAILARALITQFPDYYKAWYGQKWIDYNHIKQANRNHLLWQDASVDGLKTGHTDEAGYCLVASAERGGMRLISVVMGAPTSGARTTDSEALLNWGFRSYTTHELFAANQPIAKPRVWFGQQDDVALGIPSGLFITVPKGQYQNLKAFLTLDNNYIEAPITKGQKMGNVDVTLDNKPMLKEPVVALEANPKGNVTDRLKDRVILFFHRA